MILRLLSEPKPVSRLWDEYKSAQERVPNSATVTFGWFVLALDLLFILQLIQVSHNRLERTGSAPSAPARK